MKCLKKYVSTTQCCPSCSNEKKFQMSMVLPKTVCGWETWIKCIICHQLFFHWLTSLVWQALIFSWLQCSNCYALHHKYIMISTINTNCIHTRTRYKLFQILSMPKLPFLVHFNIINLINSTGSFVFSYLPRSTCVYFVLVFFSSFLFL